MSKPGVEQVPLEVLRQSIRGPVLSSLDEYLKGGELCKGVDPNRGNRESFVTAANQFYLRTCIPSSNVVLQKLKELYPTLKVRKGVTESEVGSSGYTHDIVIIEDYSSERKNLIIDPTIRQFFADILPLEELEEFGPIFVGFEKDLRRLFAKHGRESWVDNILDHGIYAY